MQGGQGPGQAQEGICCSQLSTARAGGPHTKGHGWRLSSVPTHPSPLCVHRDALGQRGGAGREWGGHAPATACLQPVWNTSLPSFSWLLTAVVCPWLPSARSGLFPSPSLWPMHHTSQPLGLDSQSPLIEKPPPGAHWVLPDTHTCVLPSLANVLQAVALWSCVACS